MRKLLVGTAFLLFAGIAFGQTSNTAKVDIEAEKAALNETLDNMDLAIKAQDVSAMVSYLSEDVLICGTAPSEFWNKQQITDLWTQMLENTVFDIKYLGDREIKVAPDGNSAIVVTQFMVPIYSPKIPWRGIYYFVKTNDNWVIHFSSSAFIPENEDIQKLNEAID